MKNYSVLLLLAGLFALWAQPSYAQDYPLWLSDRGHNYNEYPTAIASVPGATVSVGFYDNDFEIYEVGQNPYYTIPCIACAQPEDVFIKWREEAGGSTWSAYAYVVDGKFNNRVDVQSVPQVDLSHKGYVYVSFTYTGVAYIKDAHGNTINLGSSKDYDLAVVKFDALGHYVWHFVERSISRDFITDLDYSDETGRLAIAGYVQGKVSNPPLVFSGSNTAIPPFNEPSTMGTNYAFGNAFAAVYEDNGNTYKFLWGTETNVPTYSTDVVMGDNGRVFMSGYLQEGFGIAGTRSSGNYVDVTKRYVYQYFLVGFEKDGTPMWSELYGTRHNELNISAGLRISSLAISPKSNRLFFAFNNTGSNTAVFEHFGTYVSKVDENSGGLILPILVGTPTHPHFTTIPNLDQGSPTYNPNITVYGGEQVFISGNFLLSDSKSNSIGAAFEGMELGSTYFNHRMTRAGQSGHSEVVGWYTAQVDFGSGSIVEENPNLTYVPNDLNQVAKQLPVYGTAHSIEHDNQFYSALGFKNGEIELDLSVNHGIVNTYNNGGNPQFDGLLVRTDANRHVYSRSRGDDLAQDQVHSLEGLSSQAWTLSPNPVQAQQTLFWKSEQTDLVVDQIRLMDLTGRVLQTWNTPQVSAQGFQLVLEDLVPGTYFLEANMQDKQQHTLLVVQ